jgi:hypothetical protein
MVLEPLTMANDFFSLLGSWLLVPPFPLFVPLDF